MLNLGIFGYIWDVICPNWWTLAMVVVALFTWLGFMWYYNKHQVKSNEGNNQVKSNEGNNQVKPNEGNNQVKPNRALIEVGKRWANVGLAIIIFAFAIYAIEMVCIHHITCRIIDNPKKPKVIELQNMLRVAEMDVNRFHRANYDKIKTYNELEKMVNDANYGLTCKTVIPYATARKLELERKFSQRLANTPFSKLPKLYNEPSDRDSKLIVRNFVKGRLAYATDSENYNKFQEAAFKEFVNQEYKDTIGLLKDALQDKFANRVFSFNAIEDDNSTNWGDFKKNNPGSVTDESKKYEENKELQDFNVVLRKRATENANNPTTFRDLLSVETCDNILHSIEKCRKNCFSTFGNIFQKAIAACENEPDFDQKDFAKQKSLFFKKFNSLLGKKWNEAYQANVNLDNQEHMLYSNDKTDLEKLSIPKLKKFFDFNKCLNVALDCANFVLNLFWFVLIALVAWLIFIRKGKKIRSIANSKNITSKIERGK